ncbi:MAG: glycosyltransferase family 4 protein [Streptococcaceae bacterium]|nr:glycosyltransferase family 4 protein [Streptococcaceae bacterium]
MSKNVVIFSLKGPSKKAVIGGAEVYIDNFAKVLAKQGMKVTILCGRDKGEDDLPDTEELAENVLLKRFKSPMNFLPLSIFKTHTYYNKELKKRTDLVIENQQVFPLFAAVYKKHICTIVYHLTGNDFIRKQGIIKGSIGIFLERGIFPLLYKKKPIITMSEHSKELLIEAGLREEKISIIPPIVDVEAISEEERKQPRENIISYIGRYTGRGGNKRIDHVIEVLPKIAEKVPDVKLKIAGYIRELDELKEIVFKAGVENRVEFLGLVSEEEKLEMMQVSKVFASPSYEESFGITYIEANAKGTPVVGYEISGLDTVPETAGVMVEKDDLEKLADESIELLTNDGKWNELSVGSVENGKRFTRNVIEGKIAKFMEGLLSK